MFFVPFPKAGYMLREKDIYENSKDAVSIRVGWIHPANLNTSKNTKVYFLLTLLVYFWLAETQSEKSAFLYFAGQCLRDKLLEQGLANIFCKGPDSKYFQLCRS